MIGLKQEFKNYWKYNFSYTIPISYLFKQVYKERWLRIHSLPNSKRYAKNETEMKIILDRQNQIFADSLLDADEIYLVTRIFGDEKLLENLNLSDFTALDNNDFPPFIEEGAVDEMQFEVKVSKQKWKKHKFNAILSEIADDRLELFFVSTKSKIILAPYDGGMDIIYPTENERNLFKEKYKYWLSAHKDGL